MLFPKHSLRISHKLSGLMIGLIVGFSLIGLTYFNQIRVDQETQILEENAILQQNQLIEINLLQLKLQVASSQLFTTRDINQIEIYEGIITQVISSWKDYTARHTNIKLISQYEKIGELFVQHQQKFYQSVDILSNFGFSNATGLRGELDTIALELRQQLQDYRDIRSITSLLNVQNQVNDFIVSEDDQKITPVTEELEAFNSRLMSVSLAPEVKRSLVKKFKNYKRTVEETASVISLLNQLRNEVSSIDQTITRALQALLKTSKTHVLDIASIANEKKHDTQMMVMGIIIIVALGAALGCFFIYRGILFPMRHIQSVIKKINQGKKNTRVKYFANDELGELAKAFNTLLEERINQLEEQSNENDKLNNSIIALIQALGSIAKKDLTIKVPVSADITGTISDAVNLFTTETAKTLQQVQNISSEVNHACNKMHEQSDTVLQFADNERKQIIATSKALEVLARAMNEVAKQADNVNTTATIAVESTQIAKTTVLKSVEGIRTIRETISETEKRIKRLGERSQEISGVVNLINSIAERTHILALNAGMHAASAGEAGKGFAVVADEVQRLAESARLSTDEISDMVNNIRVETKDTVTIINTLITQVAEGSQLAEQAGESMDTTEMATHELVRAVRVIAQHATQQADVANRVKDRSSIIRQLTERTGQQLLDQKALSEVLRSYSETLVQRIQVFKLPNNKPTPQQHSPHTLSHAQAKKSPPGVSPEPSHEHATKLATKLKNAS